MPQQIVVVQHLDHQITQHRSQINGCLASPDRIWGTVLHLGWYKVSLATEALAGSLSGASSPTEKNGIKSKFAAKTIFKISDIVFRIWVNWSSVTNNSNVGIKVKCSCYSIS